MFSKASEEVEKSKMFQDTLHFKELQPFLENYFFLIETKGITCFCPLTSCFYFWESMYGKIQNVCLGIFITVLFIIQNDWKQTCNKGVTVK